MAIAVGANALVFAALLVRLASSSRTRRSKAVALVLAFGGSLLGGMLFKGIALWLFSLRVQARHPTVVEFGCIGCVPYWFGPATTLIATAVSGGAWTLIRLLRGRPPSSSGSRPA